jgi:hypothetical protein
MEFNEIKEKFENKNYLIRHKFIEEYNFKDDFLDYYKQFIKQNINQIKDKVYLSDLIDFSSYLELFEDDIFDKIVTLLFEKRHLVVKLSAVLYLEDAFDEGKKEQVLEVFDNLLKTRIPRFLRNQILISLLQLDISNKIEIRELLSQSLIKTNNVNSIYRILNLINDFNISNSERKTIIHEIAKLHKKKDFGKGVNALLMALGSF